MTVKTKLDALKLCFKGISFLEFILMHTLIFLKCNFQTDSFELPSIAQILIFPIVQNVAMLIIKEILPVVFVLVVRNGIDNSDNAPIIHAAQIVLNALKDLAENVV